MTERWQCNCGSGLAKRDLTDARGIFCTYVCDKCEGEKRKQFRTEIFTDSNYEHDEPIEEEDPAEQYERGPDEVLGGPTTLAEEDEDRDEPTAQITITESEAKVLAQLIFDTEDPDVTADMATTLLEKLRQAVFREW